MRTLLLSALAFGFVGCGEAVTRDGCHHVLVFSGSRTVDEHRSAWDIRQVAGGWAFESMGGRNPVTLDSGSVFTDLKVEVAYGQGEECPWMTNEASG